MRCAPFTWETSPLEVVAVAKVAGLVALVVADMVGVARVARVLYKLRPEDRWGLESCGMLDFVSSMMNSGD